MKRALTLAGGLVLAAAAVATAQIERLTLDEMVARTDNAVIATITASRVFRIDHPTDGIELYFTTLTLQGTSLVDGSAQSVDVTYAGGFIDDENGVYNSEAPSADDVKLGNRVVVFYDWTENMGGDVAANALYAAHGGLYRTVEGPAGTVVLGRGEGYAVSSNMALGDLDKAVTSISNDIKKRGR